MSGRGSDSLSQCGVADPQRWLFADGRGDDVQVGETRTLHSKHVLIKAALPVLSIQYELCELTVKVSDAGFSCEVQR